MMKRPYMQFRSLALFPAVLLLWLLPSQPVLAETRYDACIAKVNENPAKALEEAQKWKSAKDKSTDDPGALHCEALALSALGRHLEAAESFVAIAEALPNAPDADRAAIWVQAGVSYLSAERPDDAKNAYDKAIALQPENSEYLMDRAQIEVLAKDWYGVRSDTGAVLAQHPNSVPALTLRANASRMLGGKEAALADAERAVSIAPHDLAALLERGLCLEANGYGGKARADWENVIYYAQAMGRTGDPIIEEARGYLAKSSASPR